jgi:hypothetical protein
LNSISNELELERSLKTETRVADIQLEPLSASKAAFICFFKEESSKRSKQIKKHFRATLKLFI